MRAGFLMSVEIAEKFYTRCLEREAVTEKERIQILEELVEEESGKIRSISEEGLKATMHGKNVLVVKGKQCKPRINLNFKRENENG
jgi:hypothetical protein